MFTSKVGHRHACAKCWTIAPSLPITAESIAIVAMVPVALRLPTREPVHVHISCAEAHSYKT